VAETFVALWVALVGLFLIVPFAGAAVMLRINRSRERGRGNADASAACEVIVPITGALPGQEKSLETLLTQTHPKYTVSFVVENESDPANAIVDRLLSRHPEARKIVSGRATSCSQKNHNLNAAVRRLRPETEVVVFCDATNSVGPNWLMRFTRAITSNGARVVTTFRDFVPTPPTLGGVCQAMYATVLLLGMRLNTQPWGGATAIHRKVLEDLKVTEAWSRTVVDDLILGNLLGRRGIPTQLDLHHRVRSPVRDQTWRGFVAYLERQFLYPKFTNPGIWVAALVGLFNLVGATSVALLTALVLQPWGMTGRLLGGVAWVFLTAEILGALILRGVNPYRIPAKHWLMSFFPCVFLSGLAFVRTIGRRHIKWHGRCYEVGRGGIVLSVTDGER
jgi:hypothetical protein